MNGFHLGKQINDSDIEAHSVIEPLTFPQISLGDIFSFKIRLLQRPFIGSESKSLSSRTCLPNLVLHIFK